MKQRSRTEKPKKGRTQTNHKTRKLEQSSSMVGLNQSKQKILIYSSFVFLSFFSFLLFVFLSLFLFLFFPVFCFKVKEARLFVVLLFCFCCFCCLAMSKERTTKTKITTKPPCFIVFLFVLLSLQGFGHRKANIERKKEEESKTARRRKKKEEENKTARREN